MNLAGDPWEYWPRLKLLVQRCFEVLDVPFAGITLNTKRQQQHFISYDTLSLLAFLVIHVAVKQCRSKPAEMEWMGKFINFACKAVALECKAVQPQHLLIKFSFEVLGSGSCHITLVLTPYKIAEGHGHLSESSASPQTILGAMPEKIQLLVTWCKAYQAG